MADCPEVTTGTTPQEVHRQDAYCPTRATLQVTLLGSEWNSSAGGLSTLNRELAIHLSRHPKVEVSLLVPEGACKDEEKREAQCYGITVVDAKKRPAFDPLDWLSFPPPDLSMDIVVGHGVKLGRQGQIIRDSPRFHNCKWVQVVHTAPEDLSKYKGYADPISEGERKHQDEVDLCKLADLVVPVGPRLEKFYSSYLRRCKKDQDVFSITPGLFDREFGGLEQAPNDNADFKVLIFGRGDHEDFELKGYNIAAEAFTDQRLKKKPYHLIFVGAPEGKQDEVRQKLLQYGIAEEQLTVRKFIQSRERMKDLLCEADLAIMPSKSEGFGLVALEALSAGLPILVGSKSGFAKALENVLFGHSCIVSSDDPTKWAEAIEAVCSRHGMRLREIKVLTTSYETTYCWKEQCEALVEKMRRIVHEPVVGLQDVVEEEPSAGSGVVEAINKPCSVQQYQKDEEKEVSGTNEGPSKVSLKSPRGEQQLPSEKGPQPEKRAFVTNEEGASFTGTSPTTQTMTHTLQVKITTQGLNDQQQKTFDEIVMQQANLFMTNNTLYTWEGLDEFIQYITESRNLTLKGLRKGCLEVLLQCPTLESLESLWNDYCSGHLNEVAERCLVTDEIKKKLNLETVRLKTIITEENYLTCREALMETSCPSNENVSIPKVECLVENLPSVHPPDTIVGPPLKKPLSSDEKYEKKDPGISEEVSASSLSEEIWPAWSLPPSNVEFPSVPVLSPSISGFTSSPASCKGMSDTTSLAEQRECADSESSADSESEDEKYIVDIFSYVQHNELRKQLFIYIARAGRSNRTGFLQEQKARLGMITVHSDIFSWRKTKATGTLFAKLDLEGFQAVKTVDRRKLDEMRLPEKITYTLPPCNASTFKIAAKLENADVTLLETEQFNVQFNVGVPQGTQATQAGS